MSTEHPGELKTIYQRTSIIGVVFLLAIFAYGFLVSVIARGNGPSGTVKVSSTPYLKYVLILVSVVQIAAIHFFRKIILAQSEAPKNPIKLQNTSIVIFAMCEAVAIYGVLAVLLTWNMFDFYPFAFLSLISFALYFPRYRDWEIWLNS